jgi:hypothetical protein
LKRDGFTTWLLNPDVSQARLQKLRARNPEADVSWRRYRGGLVDFQPKLQRRRLVIELK